MDRSVNVAIDTQSMTNNSGLKTQSAELCRTHPRAPSINVPVTLPSMACPLGVNLSRTSEKPPSRLSPNLKTEKDQKF